MEMPLVRCAHCGAYCDHDPSDVHKGCSIVLCNTSMDTAPGCCATPRGARSQDGSPPRRDPRLLIAESGSAIISAPSNDSRMMSV